MIFFPLQWTHIPFTNFQTLLVISSSMLIFLDYWRPPTQKERVLNLSELIYDLQCFITKNFKKSFSNKINFFFIIIFHFDSRSFIWKKTKLFYSLIAFFWSTKYNQFLNKLHPLLWYFFFFWLMYSILGL